MMSNDIQRRLMTPVDSTSFDAIERAMASPNDRSTFNDGRLMILIEFFAFFFLE